jgi:membrane fusion protein, multidrug efflux system
MTKTGRIVAILIFALLAAAVAVPRFLASRSPGAAAENAPQPAAERVAGVAVHVVESGPLEERLSTTGTLRANEQIEVTAEISGKVAALHFREGSEVEAGQVLVTIDASELTAQRDRASHRVDLSRRREARQRQLLEDGLISSQDYDFARTDLEVLEAELTLVEAQLAKTSVKAPFEGVVGLRFVSPGAYVTPQTRIASLQDLDPMKVDFSVPERYVGRVAVGQKVDLSVAGVDDRFDAEIYAIEPAVDQATRSLVVRARMPNPRGRLRPGAFADVSVIVAQTPAALTVPSVAIIPELGGKKVFVVEDGVAVSRVVETGIRTETSVEVTSGLEVGDRVIVRGLQGLTAGTRVDAVPL